MASYLISLSAGERSSPSDSGSRSREITGQISPHKNQNTTQTMTLSIHNVKTIAGKRDTLANVGAHVVRIEGHSANGEPFALSIFSRDRLEFEITDEQAENPDQIQLPLEPPG